MDLRNFLTTRFQYPFPNLLNPLADDLQEYHCTKWIDGELRHLLPEADRERYKRTNMGYMTARWWPHTSSFERFIPMLRLMVFSIYNDDMYEQCEPKEISRAQESTVAILKGLITAKEARIPLGEFLEEMRKSMLQFIPPSSVDRFADTVGVYFDGVEVEAMYKKENLYPTVANYKDIRSRSIMVGAFVELIEVEMGITLPYEIYKHPHVQRLYSLVVCY